jgi:hypothetical protein
MFVPVHTFTMTKRTVKRLLLKYNLERDVVPMYKFGLLTANDVRRMDLMTIKHLKLKDTFHEYKCTRYRLKATFAQYCFMYKQETGKDHTN